MQHRKLWIALALLSLAPTLAAQDTAGNMPANASPAFEVSTIKPANPEDESKDFSFEGRIFKARNYNVEDLIALGYGLHAKQVFGEPRWFATSLYDIDGIPDTPGLPDMQQKFVMIRKLLAERFHFAYHLEQRTLPCYILTTAKGGPKLNASAAGANEPGFFQWQHRLGDLRVTNMTFADFVVWFQKNVTDKPLIDRTGLTGRYDFALTWSPGPSEFPQFRRTGGFTVSADSPESAKLPGIYQAFAEQLGLKLTPAKAPVEVMVIDHAEQPSPN